VYLIQHDWFSVHRNARLSALTECETDPGKRLSRRENGELLYAGKVENGFDKTAESEIRERAERLKTSIQPLSKKIKKPKATWLKPKLLVDVEYRALTGTGKLRHLSFMGIREDL
jgi:bifunctional non-homologous end joining protein LigD